MGSVMCPNCGAEYRARRNQRARALQCGACRHRFLVPLETADEGAATHSEPIRPHEPTRRSASASRHGTNALPRAPDPIDEVLDDDLPIAETYHDATPDEEELPDVEVIPSDVPSQPISPTYAIEPSPGLRALGDIWSDISAPVVAPLQSLAKASPPKKSSSRGKQPRKRPVRQEEAPAGVQAIGLLVIVGNLLSLFVGVAISITKFGLGPGLFSLLCSLPGMAIQIVVYSAYLGGQAWAFRLGQVFGSLTTMFMLAMLPVVAVHQDEPLLALLLVGGTGFNVALLYYHMTPRVEAFFRHKVIMVYPYFISWHFWVPTTMFIASLGCGSIVAIATAAMRAT